MSKSSTPAPERPASDRERRAAFRARAEEALRERTIHGRVVMVSTLLAPAEATNVPQRHGQRNSYTDYLCRCEPCSEAYSRYREGRRSWLHSHRTVVHGLNISTLLGTPGYPGHGVVTGTYWYGCECETCVRAKSRPDARAENWTHLVPREDDGVLVSTLLGTQGYPAHGTYSGADWFGCWCEDCRDAKNTLARLGYVLRRAWPSTPPVRGEVSEIARTVFATWQADGAERARERIAGLLRGSMSWTTKDHAAIPAVTDRLMAALGVPAEGPVG